MINEIYLNLNKNIWGEGVVGGGGGRRPYNHSNLPKKEKDNKRCN